MAKKLSKILWHDTKVDGTGKPVLPSVATDEKGLNGILPGELFMHVGKEKVSLWALSLSGEVVEVSGKTDEVDIDLSYYLLKSVWDSVFEIKTDVSGQKYLFGKLPVVTKYGITMYADDGNVDIPQLAEGLPFDQRTIWFNPETKQIEVIGGTGGGVSNFWDLSGIPSWITNSKPIYNYSEIKNTPDLSVFVTGTALSETLADYATLTYLTGELKKYVTLDGAQDIKGVKNFVNGLKIGGMPITKMQDDVIYLDANLVVRGGITMYAENEVDIPSIIESLPIANANTQDKASKGIASFDSAYFKVTDGWVTLTSAPSSGASYLGELLNVDDSIDAVASVDRILYQPQGSSVWTWRELPKDGVVGDYLPLSGGTLSGFLNIKAPNPNYASTICYKSYYDETFGYIGYETVDRVRVYDRHGSGLGVITTKGISIAWDEVWTDIHGQTHPWYGLHFQPNKLDVFTATMSSYYGMMLITAQGFVSITESGNVGVGTTSPTSELEVNGSLLLRKSGWTAYNIERDNLGSSSIGGIDTSGVYFSHTNNSTTTYFYLTAGFGITIHGNLLSSGGITMYSDQRKKTILNHVELSLKQIADAPLIQHYYNSDQNRTTHVGSIAQYWAKLNDWFCKLDNEGFYTMEIQNCALASAISIARHLEKYESKTDKTIRKMKQRIQELEDEVERLKQN